jgi:hypothetical protein
MSSGNPIYVRHRSKDPESPAEPIFKRTNKNVRDP